MNSGQIPAAAEYHRRGMMAAQNGAFDEAIGHLREALKLAPANPRLLHDLGQVQIASGYADDAIDSFRQAAQLQPDAAGAFFSLGNALFILSRHAEAADAFRRAVILMPQIAAGHVQLGMALLELDHGAEAETSFRQAIALDPNLPGQVHYLFGMALEAQQRFPDAIAAYRTAIARAPDEAGAHEGLGRLLFVTGDFVGSHDAFKHFAALRAAEVPKDPPADLPLAKEKHDREQMAYLLDEALAPAAAATFRAATDGGRSYRIPGILHIEGGQRLTGPALSPALDTKEIETRWFAAKPNVVVVDDLLTPEALDGLRRFCWGSTIWRTLHAGGYLGAVPAHGFAAPMVTQVSDELAAKLPRIFRNHPLVQTWAFKYDSTLNGIGIHADGAAVNVNFWITPDEANLDSEHGGLVIWDVPAPLDWDFEKFNNDYQAIHEFLERNGAKSITVPYRANRAVIFDSDLFHQTDRILFAEGYKNRRINITLLYGHRETAL